MRPRTKTCQRLPSCAKPPHKYAIFLSTPPIPVFQLTSLLSQALDWLYTHYWLPTISSASNSAVPLLPLDALRPLLASYKTLTKSSLRDASKTNQLKPELAKVHAGIEGWVLEAESLGRGRDRAMEGLVEAMLEVGGLVPTAKK